MGSITDTHIDDAMVDNGSINAESPAGDVNVTSVLMSRSLWSMSIIGLVLMLLILTAVLGNLMVIYTIYTNHRLREQHTNLFIMNLSFTDLLNAVLVMSTSLYMVCTDGQTVAVFWCHFNCATNYCLIIVSMMTLAGISVDRYFAIIYPLTYSDDMTRNKVRIMITYPWLQGMAFALAPVLLDWINYDYWELVCAIDWHHEQEQAVYYVIVAFIMCFALPGLIMLYAYIRIILEAKKAQSRDNASMGGLSSDQRHTARIIRSLLIVVACFFMCMTPFCVTKLLKVIFDNNFVPNSANVMATVFQYVSSMINPFIYAIFRRDFRSAFRKILWQATCKLSKKPLSYLTDSNFISNSRAPEINHINENLTKSFRQDNTYLGTIPGNNCCSREKGDPQQPAGTGQESTMCHGTGRSLQEAIECQKRPNTGQPTHKCCEIITTKQEANPSIDQQRYHYHQNIQDAGQKPGTNESTQMTDLKSRENTITQITDQEPRDNEITQMIDREPRDNKNTQMTDQVPRDKESTQMTDPEPRDNESTQMADPEPRDNESTQMADPEPRDNESIQMTDQEPRGNESIQMTDQEPRDNESTQMADQEPRDNRSTHITDQKNGDNTGTEKADQVLKENYNTQNKGQEPKEYESTQNTGQEPKENKYKLDDKMLEDLKTHNIVQKMQRHQEVSVKRRHCYEEESGDDGSQDKPSVGQDLPSNHNKEVLQLVPGAFTENTPACASIKSESKRCCMHRFDSNSILAQAGLCCESPNRVTCHLSNGVSILCDFKREASTQSSQSTVPHSVPSETSHSPQYFSAQKYNAARPCSSPDTVNMPEHARTVSAEAPNKGHRPDAEIDLESSGVVTECMLNSAVSYQVCVRGNSMPLADACMSGKEPDPSDGDICSRRNIIRITHSPTLDHKGSLLQDDSIPMVGE